MKALQSLSWQFLSVFFLFPLPGSAQDAASILRKVDQNLNSKNRVMESEMIIHGRRNSRTIVSKTWAVGDQQAFTEYLSPAREAGTKMLKLEDQLWIYSPSTDRIIQISGHMLRQSVMGSDLSYEDMMEDRSLSELYVARLEGREVLDGREVYVIVLEARVEEIAYQKQKLWVDAERFVPLRQEMFARSGQLLKEVVLSDVRKAGDRWFPSTMVYRDVLKDGKGTEFRIREISFDVEIPGHIFTKASLRK
jgi:outer membrane lipoprotein-sorting protein